MPAGPTIDTRRAVKLPIRPHLRGWALQCLMVLMYARRAP